MPERLQTYQNGVEKSQCISIQCGGHSISFQLDWNLTQEHTPEHSQEGKNDSKSEMNKATRGSPLPLRVNISQFDHTRYTN